MWGEDISCGMGMWESTHIGATERHAEKKWVGWEGEEAMYLYHIALHALYMSLIHALHFVGVHHERHGNTWNATMQTM